MFVAKAAKTAFVESWETRQADSKRLGVDAPKTAVAASHARQFVRSFVSVVGGVKIPRKEANA
jgi:hypothetical protein